MPALRIPGILLLGWIATALAAAGEGTGTVAVPATMRAAFHRSQGRPRGPDAAPAAHP